MDIRDYQNISTEVSHPVLLDDIRLPMIDWFNEDKSSYMRANKVVNDITKRNYIDDDGLFLVDDNGNFRMREDFVFVNTHKISEVGEVFDETGSYLDEEPDSPEYLRWIEREEERRGDGITLPLILYKKDVDAYNAAPRESRSVYVHDITITGDHYNFINYGVMMRVDESSTDAESVTATKSQGRPRFFYSQFWWTQAKKFGRNNGLNQVVLKSRRAGWSFQEAIDSANDTNLTPNRINILCAFNLKYITMSGGIADMARDQLLFYEQYTPFNRCGLNKDGTMVGLAKAEITDMRLGYRLKGGTIAGWNSKMISVSFGPANPNAAIGKDAKVIKIEELSDAPNLAEFLNVTEPTTTAGAYKTGTIIGFGTGGSTVGDWIAFKDWYFEPMKYDAMPFADVWDYNATTRSVGFFKPYIQNLEGFDDRGVPSIDQYGNPNYVAATQIYRRERANKKSGKDVSERDYTVFEGQYANMPTESFAIAGSNIFASEGLKEHAKRVMSDDDLKFYRDGWLEDDKKGNPAFRTNAKRKDDGYKVHDYMYKRKFSKGDDVHGCLREWYPPFKDDNGKTPDGLYRIYYDSVAKDKKIKDLRSDASLDCVFVEMVNNNIGAGSEQIVAIYKGRTGSLEETNKFILKLADYYNAKVLPETNRGNIVPTFIRWKRRDRLVATPIHVFDLKTKESNEVSYGINIDGPRKADGLMYLYELLYAKRGLDYNGNQLYNYHFIYDSAYLEELLSWNPEDNFDMVSTGIIQAYGRQELILKGHKPKVTKKKKDSIFNKRWYS